MKIVLMAAISKDGFITRGDDPDPTSWTSNEDKKLLSKEISKHKLLLVGANTFEAGNKANNPEKLQVVMTNNPKKYTKYEISGQREFIKATPKEFIEKYQDKYTSCLVLGGSYIFTEFLTANVVDEILLTVEPVEHGSGIPLIRNTDVADYLNGLPQPKVTKLNNKGTMLRQYTLN